MMTKPMKIEVREAERFWQSNDITAVPTVIINDRYAISGAHSAEVFETALR